MSDGLSGKYEIVITGPQGETWRWSGYAENYGDALVLADLTRERWVSD